MDDPQSIIFILRALNILGDKDSASYNLKRILKLKSGKTKYFSIKQNQVLHLQLYDNDSEDPSPLLTTWFGEFLLEEKLNILSLDSKKSLLNSISNYLIYELGFKDHNDLGIYFYYGPTVKKEIYNASAIISSFLIRAGNYLGDRNIVYFGERGIKYILYKQNSDGSWFSNDEMEESYIDNFHTTFIINSLNDCKSFTNISLEASIKHATTYLIDHFFKIQKQKISIQHFDFRYLPRNSSIIQRVDGRDIATALILFSKHTFDEMILTKLVFYLFHNFYNRKSGYFYCEQTWMWKNKIPYIEIQAWLFYSLLIVKNKNESDCNSLQ
jgi:hypothetical protein